MNQVGIPLTLRGGGTLQRGALLVGGGALPKRLANSANREYYRVKSNRTILKYEVSPHFA